MDEKAYLAGRESAAREMMRAVLGLMPRGLDRTAAAIAVELSETRASLRALCADLGDTDWPEDLHLVDVIEKHVRPHIGGGE